MSHRRNLVIVRAGDTSLHPRWLIDAEHRSWDLVVNYFGDDPEKYLRPDVTRICSKGAKWPALQRLIESQSELIRRYDYVWLPDDDIDCRAQDIDRIFDISRRRGLLLAQPALTPASHFSWIVTLKSPLVRLRYTNFVELMVPCFEREFLMRCVASMAENVSGWGLDLLWPTQVSEPRRIAILDSVAVTHTRPIGAANYQHLRDRGGTALDELRQCLASHQIWNPVIRIEAVSTWGNFCLAGRSPLARMLLWGGRIVNIVHAFALRYETCWQLRTKLRENRSSPLDEPDRLSTEQLRAFQNE